MGVSGHPVVSQQLSLLHVAALETGSSDRANTQVLKARSAFNRTKLHRSIIVAPTELHGVLGEAIS